VNPTARLIRTVVLTLLAALLLGLIVAATVPQELGGTISVIDYFGNS
jgi:hypothetical protein